MRKNKIVNIFFILIVATFYIMLPIPCFAVINHEDENIVLDITEKISNLRTIYPHLGKFDKQKHLQVNKFNTIFVIEYSNNASVINEAYSGGKKHHIKYNISNNDGIIIKITFSDSAETKNNSWNANSPQPYKIGNMYIQINIETHSEKLKTDIMDILYNHGLKLIDYK